MSYNYKLNLYFQRTKIVLLFDMCKYLWNKIDIRSIFICSIQKNVVILHHDGMKTQ